MSVGVLAERCAANYGLGGWLAEPDTDLWQHFDLDPLHGRTWELGLAAAMTENNALDGRDEVLDALDALQTELASGAGWENPSLDKFFDAFNALLGPIENGYVNTGRPVPGSNFYMDTGCRGPSGCTLL